MVLPILTGKRPTKLPPQSGINLLRVPRSLSSRRNKGKKGSLEETLSYAIHKDDPELFVVLYRDKAIVKNAPLKEFLESQDMAEIPLTRIVSILRNGTSVWKKGQKDVRVKNSV